MPMNAITLEIPSRALLAGYVDALERGWSPDTTRPEAGREELVRIAADADAFLASLVDREARGEPITLADGRRVPRLPGYRMWISDGEFCGSIGLRWQPGTTELPPYVLGHIGYAVVPWKRNRGCAKAALGLMLVQARREGLHEVIVTTDADNVASQRVIAAHGGGAPQRFERPPGHGSPVGLRFRLATPEVA